MSRRTDAITRTAWRDGRTSAMPWTSASCSLPCCWIRVKMRQGRAGNVAARRCTTSGRCWLGRRSQPWWYSGRQALAKVRCSGIMSWTAPMWRPQGGAWRVLVQCSGLRARLVATASRPSIATTIWACGWCGRPTSLSPLWHSRTDVPMSNCREPAYWYR
jgi:hypothetical protein